MWRLAIYGYPGITVEVFVNAQDRIEQLRVTVPDGWRAYVRVINPGGQAIVDNQPYSTGVTEEPFSPPIPQDTGFVIGMSSERLTAL